MRRIIVMSTIGLALAFGAFYYFSWPSTLSGSLGDGIGFNEEKAGELLHSSQFVYDVRGPREIKILTVKLNDPSPGIELVATRMGTGGEAGARRGEVPEIESLPRAPGTVLKSGDQGAFVVTFRVLDPGRFTFSGIAITYQTGWLTRTVKLGPKVTVRVPEPSSTPTPSPS